MIDTWLMSCRVLNRLVEHATLNYLVRRAGAAGVHSLIGEYVETDRNGMVKDHYARLGFEALDARQDRTRWQLQIASYGPRPLPMETVEVNSTVETMEESLISA